MTYSLENILKPNDLLCFCNIFLGLILLLMLHPRCSCFFFKLQNIQFSKESSLTSPTRVRMYFYCATRDSWLPLPEVDSQLQKFGNWHLLSSFLHKLSKKFVVLKKIVTRLFRFFQIVPFLNCKSLSRVKKFFSKRWKTRSKHIE